MKKFIAVLTTAICLAFTQSMHAIPSNLGESLREYQAIINAEEILQTAISQSEFIIDIRRITRSIEASTVRYEIKTVIFDGVDVDTNADLVNHETGLKFPYVFHREKKYEVKLSITPNPQIGPPIITVVSIKPISRHSHEFFEEGELIEEEEKDN